MSTASRIKHVRACSDHLTGLGYNNQCVDEFEGTVYLLGSCEDGFHMHKLYKVRKIRTIKSRKERIADALSKYKFAFDMKDY